MKVKVEQRHINNGKRSCDNSCPLALAIREKLNIEDDQVSVEISPRNVVIEEEKYYVDDDTLKIIERFDDTGVMEPFETELELHIEETEEDEGWWWTK